MSKSKREAPASPTPHAPTSEQGANQPQGKSGGLTATDWLKQCLEREGPLPSWRVMDLATAAGFSQSAVKRARTQLGLTFTREGANRMGLIWALSTPGEELRAQAGDEGKYDKS